MLRTAACIALCEKSAEFGLGVRFLLSWHSRGRFRRPPPASAAIAACSDTAWAALGWKLPSNSFNWGFHYNPLTTPPNVSDAGNAIMAGAGGWNEKRVSASGCDPYAASWTGFGRQPDTTAAPGALDQYNQVGFQNFNALAASTDAACAGAISFKNYYAFVCGWGSGGFAAGTIHQADVILNSSSSYVNSWTSNLNTSNLGDLIVQAVATHEFGHVIGLGHVAPNSSSVCSAASNDHFNLTMYTYWCPENSSPHNLRWYSLARGDVNGLVSVPH